MHATISQEPGRPRCTRGGGPVALPVAEAVPHWHAPAGTLRRRTHTHRLFLGLFIRHGQIYAPGTSSAPNQEARGREAKTESAPRKNSLGPTIKLQGEPETKRRFQTPPCFRRPGRGTREGKVGRLPKGGGGASHGGSAWKRLWGLLGRPGGAWYCAVHGAFSGLLRVAL